MEEIYDLAIIGSGPAGMSAAIYGARMGLKVIIFEKGAPGGRLLNTHLIENYPGIDSVSGGQLAQGMFSQMTKLDIKIAFEEIIDISDGDIKLLKTSIGLYKSYTIFISSGLTPKMIDAKGVEKFFGNGLSTCVICDGAFYKGKPIALIGGGNSAMEESLFAKTIASKVYIINKFDLPVAEKITLNKVSNSSNILIKNNSEVLELIGEQKLEAITIFNSKTNEKEIINVSGVFVYIGSEPNINYLNNLKIEKELGFILVDSNTMQTSIKGIYAGGDVIFKKYRQITTATSDGTIASLAIVKYIENLERK